MAEPKEPYSLLNDAFNAIRQGRLSDAVEMVESDRNAVRLALLEYLEQECGDRYARGALGGDAARGAIAELRSRLTQKDRWSIPGMDEALSELDSMPAQSSKQSNKGSDNATDPDDGPPR